MKKSIKLISLLLVLVLIVSGCGKKESQETNTSNTSTDYTKEPEVETTCTMFSDKSENGYKIELTEIIYSKGDAVIRENTKTVLTSDDEVILNNHKEFEEKRYKEQSEEYGGMTYSVNTNDNQVISITTLDFANVNMTNFIDNDLLNSDDMIDGYIKLDIYKLLYESTGYTCN